MHINMDILRELRFWQGAVAGFSFAAGIDFFSQKFHNYTKINYLDLI